MLAASVLARATASRERTRSPSSRIRVSSSRSIRPSGVNESPTVARRDEHRLWKIYASTGIAGRALIVSRRRFADAPALNSSLSLARSPVSVDGSRPSCAVQADLESPQSRSARRRPFLVERRTMWKVQSCRSRLELDRAVSLAADLRGAIGVTGTKLATSVRQARARTRSASATPPRPDPRLRLLHRSRETPRVRACGPPRRTPRTRQGQEGGSADPMARAREPALA